MANSSDKLKSISTQETLLSFQTKNYTVSVYCKNEQMFMDVYDKSVAEFILKTALVKVTYSQAGTGYWHKTTLRTFRVYQRADQQRWLVINELGEQGEEIWEIGI